MLDKLIKKLLNGDQAAFEEIYNQTRKSVYYVALGILRNRTLAEDAMQSTYLSVLRNLSKYQMGTNAAAWIVRIARNEALNMKKSNSREQCVGDDDNGTLFGSYQPDDYGLLINLARQVLAEDEFTIVMLVTSCGYKRREIANMFDLPISTVTWKYNTALAKIRQSMEQENK